MVDLESDRAHTLPNGVGGAAEPRHFAVTAGTAGQIGEALQDVGNVPVPTHLGRERKRIMGIASRLV